MWPSYRKFTVDSVVAESESAKSFYLVPSDGGRIAPFRPGQHLPVRLNIAGQVRPVFRCYTISDCFNDKYYRLTIKKQMSPAGLPQIPPGLSSTYFNVAVRPGDLIEAKPPAGNFYLDVERDHPVVFLGGGIGITPMISMINAVHRSQPARQVYFVFALRDGGDHVFKEHLRSLAARCSNIHLCVLYEYPRPQDVLGVDYDRKGRIHVALLREFLPTLDMEYYVCGPDGMMKAVSAGLAGAGIGAHRIKTESFGPSNAAFSAAAAEEKKEPDSRIVLNLTVTFLKSGRTVKWDNQWQSLLQLAEVNGIDINSGCRYGDCGSCSTRLFEGKVIYLHPTGARPDPGTCLPCSCKPATSVMLDA